MASVSKSQKRGHSRAISPIEHREWLESVANILRSHTIGPLISSPRARPLRVRVPGLPSPSGAADWMAGAIESYLRGDVPSLDRALGLSRGRGRPPLERISPDKLSIARKLVALRQQSPRETWARIVDRAVQERWLVTDERSLRQLYDENAGAILAERIKKLITNAGKK